MSVSAQFPEVVIIPSVRFCAHILEVLASVLILFSLYRYRICQYHLFSLVNLLLFNQISPVYVTVNTAYEFIFYEISINIQLVLSH